MLTIVEKKVNKVKNVIKEPIKVIEKFRKLFSLKQVFEIVSFKAV